MMGGEVGFIAQIALSVALNLIGRRTISMVFLIWDM